MFPDLKIFWYVIFHYTVIREKRKWRVLVTDGTEKQIFESSNALTVISSWTNRDKLAFPTVKLIRETNSRRRLILMLLDASALFTA